MVLRILLAALVACLSLPAMAAPACHAPETATIEQHGHHAPSTPDRQERATPVHVCIGCVPPASRLSATVEPLPPVALPVRIIADDMMRGRAILPALPPPRSFA